MEDRWSDTDRQDMTRGYDDRILLLFIPHKQAGLARYMDRIQFLYYSFLTEKLDWL